MLELYQFEGCPYSKKVREKMTELEIDYIIRNVSPEKEARERLVKISGQAGVPTLVDIDQDLIIAGDEEKIIDHLKKHYGQSRHKTLGRVA